MLAIALIIMSIGNVALVLAIVRHCRRRTSWATDAVRYWVDHSDIRHRLPQSDIAQIGSLGWSLSLFIESGFITVVILLALLTLASFSGLSLLAMLVALGVTTGSLALSTPLIVASVANAILLTFLITDMLLHRNQVRTHYRFMRLKEEREEFGRDTLLVHLTPVGVPHSLVNELYDYIQINGRQLVPSFPVMPSDDLYDLYGIDTSASDLIEHVASRLHCTLPNHNEWNEWPDETVEGFLLFIAPYYRDPSSTDD